MSYANRFQRERSNFYLQIYDNDDNIILSTNKFTKKLIMNYHDAIEDLSPIGWKKSKTHNDLYTLWIPEDKIDYDEIDDFIEWAEICNSCVWVKLNKNIINYFDEDVLDFCICSDWNFNFDWSGHTEIGELEYQFKYGGHFSENDSLKMLGYLNQCLNCIADSLQDVLVTTIPAVRKNQNKPSWILGKFVAKQLGVNFLKMSLIQDKPQMKSVDVSSKIHMWNQIYINSKVELSVDSDEICDKTIIIVDDLYQSGASMWCCAEYLKSLGATNVIGITLVKSLKDSDNLH